MKTKNSFYVSYDFCTFEPILRCSNGSVSHRKNHTGVSPIFESYEDCEKYIAEYEAPDGAEQFIFQIHKALVQDESK